jgi:hypothetical protein
LVTTSPVAGSTSPATSEMWEEQPRGTGAVGLDESESLVEESDDAAAVAHCLFLDGLDGLDHSCQCSKHKVRACRRSRTTPAQCVVA